MDSANKRDPEKEERETAQRLEAYDRWQTDLQAAGRPRRPTDFVPNVGDKVLARIDPDWRSCAVAAVTPESVTLTCAAKLVSPHSETAALADVYPLAVNSALPRVGAFVLVPADDDYFYTGTRVVGVNGTTVQSEALGEKFETLSLEGVARRRRRTDELAGEEDAAVITTLREEQAAELGEVAGREAKTEIGLNAARAIAAPLVVGDAEGTKEALSPSGRVARRLRQQS